MLPPYLLFVIRFDCLLIIVFHEVLFNADNRIMVGQQYVIFLSDLNDAIPPNQAQWVYKSTAPIEELAVALQLVILVYIKDWRKIKDFQIFLSLIYSLLLCYFFLSFTLFYWMSQKAFQ